MQTDKTKESVSEVDKELKGIIGNKPVSDAELAKAQKDETLKLTGAWETSTKVSKSIAEILRFGLAEDYFKTYPDKVLALKLPEVEQAAQKVVQPDHLVWVIVGDLSKIAGSFYDKWVTKFMEKARPIWEKITQGIRDAKAKVEKAQETLKDKEGDLVKAELAVCSASGPAKTQAERKRNEAKDQVQE